MRLMEPGVARDGVMKKRHGVRARRMIAKGDEEAMEMIVVVVHVDKGVGGFMG